MNKIRLLVFVLLLSASAFAQESVYIPRSKGIFDDLREGHYQKIVSQFDTSFARRMDTLKLRTIWGNILMRMGSYKSTIGIDADQQNDNWIIIQHLAFENKNVDLRILFTKEGQIKNLNLMPASLINSNYVFPAYANLKGVEERPAFVVSGTYRLPAILTVPKGPARYPVVILVHGSGANDKDEMYGGTRIFKDLSYGLSANGIAVFRYDKRTKLYHIKQMLTTTYSVQDEVLEDVISAIAAVK